VGIDPGKLLKAKPAKLAAAIKPGGMLPELRAQQLQELAFRVENEFGGVPIAEPAQSQWRNCHSFPRPQGSGQTHSVGLSKASGLFGCGFTEFALPEKELGVLVHSEGGCNSLVERTTPENGSR
jgi:hypothetical protein